MLKDDSLLRVTCSKHDYTEIVFYNYFWQRFLSSYGFAQPIVLNEVDFTFWRRLLFLFFFVFLRLIGLAFVCLITGNLSLLGLSYWFSFKGFLHGAITVNIKHVFIIRARQSKCG